jgi:hypothetical protein
MGKFQIKKSACEEIPHILGVPKVYYRVHNSPPLLPILSQMNLLVVHTLPSYFFEIYFNINLHLRLSLPNDLSSSGFPIRTL